MTTPQATWRGSGPVFLGVTGHEEVARAPDQDPDHGLDHSADHSADHRAGHSAGATLAGLVQHASEGLLRTAYLLCLDLDLAEDLVVRTWTEVARQWTPEVPQAAVRPEAWARRLLVPAALEAQGARPPAQRTQGQAIPSPSLVGRSGALALQQVEDRLEVEYALKSLAPQHRAVLVLRYYEGLSAEEAATAIGCSVSVVGRTTHDLVHTGEGAEELLAETFAWLATAVDAERVGAVTRRDYPSPRGSVRRAGAGRPAGRWPGRVWLATVLARRRGARR